MEIFTWKPQDFLAAKAPKRSPLILRMVVLFLAMICGMYIFSICLNQTNPFKERSRPTKIQVISRPNRACRHVGIQAHDTPYVHFPNPETFSRQECACNPVRLFAIVSMQRSGSGWFETLLNSHVNLSSNGEIFGAQSRRSNASVILKTLDKVYNLDWFSSASKNECSAAVGFKWMLNQGLMKYHEEIVDYMKRRGVSVIFLFRRNLLRRMISLLANIYDKDAKLLNGTHKSHVHSTHDAQVLARYKPTLNVTVLLSDLKAASQTVAKALEYFKTTRHILLYYEDILTNHTKLVDVQEFLKLPRRNLISLQSVRKWDKLMKWMKDDKVDFFYGSFIEDFGDQLIVKPTFRIINYGIISTEERHLINIDKKDVMNLEVKIDPKRFEFRSHDRKDELATEDDDFRPTTPGHSPGVGHAHGPSSSEP